MSRKPHVCGVDRPLSGCRGCQAYKRRLRSKNPHACRVCGYPRTWDDAAQSWKCHCKIEAKEPKT